MCAVGWGMIWSPGSAAGVAGPFTNFEWSRVGGVSDAKRISFPSMSEKHLFLQRAPTFTSNATSLLLHAGQSAAPRFTLSCFLARSKP